MKEFKVKKPTPWLISTVSLVGAMLGMLWLFDQGRLISLDPRVIAFQVCCFSLVLWSRFHLRSRSFVYWPRARGPLVDTGPYRYVRHPIYTGAILFVLGSYLGTGPVNHHGLAVGLIILTFAMRAHREEILLKHELEGYHAYCLRTWRFFPYLY